LAGGGTYFFGAGGTDSVDNPPPITGPGEVAQNIDVSTEQTATQIASGEAAVVLSGFFTSYNGQNLLGSLHVEFLNSGGTSLGATVVTAATPRPWHQERGVALVPVGTATLRASLFGNNNNAYIDNIDARVTNAANELLYLEVNTANGQVAIKNASGEPLNLDYYKIESAASALNATNWNSLQDQNLAGFPAGNGSGNGWEQFGGSSARVIGESYLNSSSLVSNNATLGLGAAFNVGGAQDLVFRYGTVPALAALTGDYNVNGTVDAADYVVWRDNLDASVTLPNDTTPGMVTAADYDVWRANFGAASGPAGSGTLVQGFVRYVTPGGATAAPEPSSFMLIGLGLSGFVLGGRRSTKPDNSAE
jgi:hypothetical protein